MIRGGGSGGGGLLRIPYFIYLRFMGGYFLGLAHLSIARYEPSDDYRLSYQIKIDEWGRSDR